MVTLGRSVYLPAKYMSTPGRLTLCALVRPGFTLLSGIRPKVDTEKAVSGAEGGAGVNSLSCQPVALSDPEAGL